jgi:hypothetical protein
MSRITERDLYAAVERLNAIIHGNPNPAHNAPSAYFLQGAYGGWQLQRNAPNGRGCESVTSGYVSKPALYELIHAYGKGYATAVADRHAAVFGTATAPSID